MGKYEVENVPLIFEEVLTVISLGMLKLKLSMDLLDFHPKLLFPNLRIKVSKKLRLNNES